MICFSAHFSMITWQQNVRKGAQTQIREGGHSADGDDEGKVKGGDETGKRGQEGHGGTWNVHLTSRRLPATPYQDATPFPRPAEVRPADSGGVIARHRETPEGHRWTTTKTGRDVRG